MTMLKIAVGKNTCSVDKRKTSASKLVVNPVFFKNPSCAYKKSISTWCENTVRNNALLFLSLRAWLTYVRMYVCDLYPSLDWGCNLIHIGAQSWTAQLPRSAVVARWLPLHQPGSCGRLRRKRGPLSPFLSVMVQGCWWGYSLLPQVSPVLAARPYSEVGKWWCHHWSYPPTPPILLDQLLHCWVVLCIQCIHLCRFPPMQRNSRILGNEPTAAPRAQLLSLQASSWLRSNTSLYNL